MRNRIDRLTNLQVSFLVSSTIIGVTVLSLPRIAAELAKAAGPITTLITGILMALVLVIIALFAKRFPNDTIIEYSAELIGFIPSKILGLIFYIYFSGSRIKKSICFPIPFRHSSWPKTTSCKWE
jgi:spore germination protein